MQRRFARWGGMCLALALIMASAALADVVQRAAASTATATCGADPAEPGPPDFNHDGKSDFVVGMPGARGGIGAIEVVEGGHRPVIYRPGTHGIPVMPVGARFGSTTEVFDANGDGCADLLVSAPGLSVHSIYGAGGIVVMFGGSRGLSAGTLLTQRTAGVPGRPVLDGHFGTALFTDGYGPTGGHGFQPLMGSQLDVGVPGASVTTGPRKPVSLLQAGEVVTFDLSPSGHAVRPGSDLVRTMPVPAAGAHFGTAIGENYATAPDAPNGKLSHAGYIRIWNSDYYGTKAKERLGATVAVGPASNTADELYGLFVGAPGYRVGGHLRAGAVQRFNVEFDGPAVYNIGLTTQASHGVPGKAQTGARFGAAISIGYVFVGAAYDAEVAIGAPGATVNAEPGAGRIDVNSLELMYNGPTGFVSKHWTSETLATPHVPGAPRRDEGFGRALADYSLGQSNRSPLRLVIGVPGARVGDSSATGEVQVTPLSLDGLTKHTARQLRQVNGPHEGDDFGVWLDGQYDVNPAE